MAKHAIVPTPATSTIATEVAAIAAMETGNCLESGAALPVDEKGRLTRPAAAGLLALAAAARKAKIAPDATAAFIAARAVGCDRAGAVRAAQHTLAGAATEIGAVVHDLPKSE